jgi:hypothetical protein
VLSRFLKARAASAEDNRRETISRTLKFFPLLLSNLQQRSQTRKNSVIQKWAVCLFNGIRLLRFDRMKGEATLV